MILSSFVCGLGFANPCPHCSCVPMLLTQQKPYALALGLIGLLRVGQPVEIVDGNALIQILNFIIFNIINKKVSFWT